MTEQKPYSEELRKKLDDYRLAGKKTMTELGQELGVSSTRVNKYLTGKPEGDVEEFEALVADMLKAARTRTITKIKPFDTSATELIHVYFETARKTNDFALIVGPAGVGKTMSKEMYCASHPTTLSITILKWMRTDSGVAALLFEACDTRSWTGHEPKAVYLARRLKKSNRLIIVDNAQRMTIGAQQWLFDFHNETDCPVALLGNPEILNTIRKCDQHLSRVGIFKEINLDPKKIGEYAKAMVNALVAKPAAGLYDLSTTVAENQGHLRSLRKQLLLMLDLCETKLFDGDQIRAFHAAHTKLVRDYKL